MVSARRALKIEWDGDGKVCGPESRILITLGHHTCMGGRAAPQSHKIYIPISLDGGNGVLLALDQALVEPVLLQFSMGYVTFGRRTPHYGLL